ncbi:hypothetical protein ABW20_dc0106857 [Dactylellina cionopaga]|nr:hypothetical protein ABW20_dc0106857 [Dactylellina cionopaga]
MLFSKLLPVAALLSLAAAVPAAAPAPAPVAEAVAEAVPKAAPDATPDVAPAVIKIKSKEFQKREWGANAFCHVWQGDYWYGTQDRDWYFEYDTWGSWDDDWGSGFLDNLRSKCGTEIQDWGFRYDSGAPPTWGHATFKIHGLAFGGPNLPWCTLDAVRAASWAWGPISPGNCEYPGWKWW